MWAAEPQVAGKRRKQNPIHTLRNWMPVQTEIFQDLKFKIVCLILSHKICLQSRCRLVIVKIKFRTCSSLILAKRAEKLLSSKTQCGGQSYYYVHNWKKKNFSPLLECGRQFDSPEFDLLNSYCSSCGGCLYMLRKKRKRKQTQHPKTHKQAEIVIQTHAHAHTHTWKRHTLLLFSNLIF